MVFELSIDPLPKLKAFVHFRTCIGGTGRRMKYYALYRRSSCVCFQLTYSVDMQAADVCISGTASLLLCNIKMHVKL